MIRSKTFNATGIAPGGRLYAGDLNLIQDLAAALTDLTQNISVGSLIVGEAGLTFSRFGAGEIQLAGAMRVQGILRALSGYVTGTFTTTARDAISAGSRPYGLVILNSTTNQLEWNKGTDAAPVWAPVAAGASTTGLLSARPSASSSPNSFYHATDQDVLYRSDGISWVRVSSAKAGDLAMTLNAVAETGRVLGQGQTVSRTGIYADLFAKWGTTYNTGGEAGTDFRLPDLRGRMPVALGTHADVSAVGLNDGVAVGSRRPRHKHSHGLTLPNHVHEENPNTVVAAGGGAGSSAGGVWNSIGNVGGSWPTANPSSNPAINGGVGPQTGSEPTDSAGYFVVNMEIKL